jgi:serine/threonine-protein kinase RsbW
MEELSLPGTLDSLAPLREYVDRAALAAGLEQRAAYRLRLAIDEIATNVITHGYQEAGLAGDLRVETHIGDEALTIALEDTGARYDPQSRELPEDLHRPLEERAVGGLGIFLTLTGVDEFSYSSNDGRNRNVFVMRRTPVTETEERT